MTIRTAPHRIIVSGKFFFFRAGAERFYIQGRPYDLFALNRDGEPLERAQLRRGNRRSPEGFSHAPFMILPMHCGGNQSYSDVF